MRRIIVPLSPVIFLLVLSLAFRPQDPAAVQAAETTTCACACPTADPSAVVPVTATDVGTTASANPAESTIATPTDVVTDAAATSDTTAAPAATSDTKAAPAVAETTTDNQAPFLNEIFPDPVGDDTAGEFIEVRNSGAAEAALSGWKLTANAREYVIRDVTMGAQAVYQFPYSQTRLPLANGGATVILTDPSGRVADTVRYGTARTGQSYARDEADAWHWSERPTPGTPNEIVLSETAVSGAGSNVTDTAAAVTPSDAAASTTAIGSSSSATVAAAEAPAATGTPPITGDESARQVIINEFLPNPGSGGEEWVELFNPGTTDAMLVGWSLDDGEGGSRPYGFTDADRVPASGYLVLRQPQTKLGLNNDGDAVRLIDASGMAAQTVTYAVAPVGKSLARTTDGRWQWVAESSPSSANAVEPAVGGSGIGTDTPAAMIVGDAAPARAEGEAALETTVTDLAENGGGLVTVTGVVTLPPGRIARTVFAIQGLEGGGVIVRSYAKELPRLAIGDTVTVTGRVTDLSGQTRLAAPADGGIRLAGRRSASKPDRLDLASAASENDGALVTVSGSITRFGQGWLKLADDAGETELKLLWPGLERPVPGLAVGAGVKATGVIKNKSGKPEIIVGALDDLEITAPPPAPTTTESDGGATATQTTATAPVVLVQEGYPWRAAAGATLALVGTGTAVGFWLWRRNRWQEA